MRGILLAIPVGLPFLAASALLVLVSSGRPPAAGPVQAAGDAMYAMSTEMDPDATPANTATSLGSREDCARINENDQLEAGEDSIHHLRIDVTATNIPVANPAAAFGFTLLYGDDINADTLPDDPAGLESMRSLARPGRGKLEIPAPGQA